MKIALARTEEHHVGGFRFEFEALDRDGELIGMPKEVFAWCREQFGEGKVVSFAPPWERRKPTNYPFCDYRRLPDRVRWIEGAECVWFREEDDAFAFKMRWC